MSWSGYSPPKLPGSSSLGNILINSGISFSSAGFKVSTGDPIPFHFRRRSYSKLIYFVLVYWLLVSSCMVTWTNCQRLDNMVVMCKARGPDLLTPVSVSATVGSAEGLGGSATLSRCMLEFPISKY